jgi:hypothetical protein
MTSEIAFIVALGDPQRPPRTPPRRSERPDRRGSVYRRFEPSPSRKGDGAGSFGAVGPTDLATAAHSGGEARTASFREHSNVRSPQDDGVAGFQRGRFRLEAVQVDAILAADVGDSAIREYSMTSCSREQRGSPASETAQAELRPIATAPTPSRVRVSPACGPRTILSRQARTRKSPELQSLYAWSRRTSSASRMCCSA